MYVFVKGRFIKYFKWESIEADTHKLCKINYVSFYNNKYFISDSKSGLKKDISNDIKKKKEKDEYYKRY